MSLLERIDVTPQPKREADVLTLLDELQHSPFIGEISLNEIARLLDGATLAGIAAWDAIRGPWVEIGPFYTAKAYRGQGLGSFMVDTVETIHRDGGHRFYGVTKNPVVKRMFVRRGLHQVSMWTLPREIQIHLLKKLTLRKLLRHVSKLRLGDSVSHFISSEPQEKRP